MWISGLRATEMSMMTSTVTVIASGTAHAKGSWVELVASTPFDVTMLVLRTDITHVSGTDTSQLTDIGIGAAASEIVLIENVPTGYSTLRELRAKRAYFPAEIPSGTRISGRMQAAITSDVVKVGVELYGRPLWSGGTFQSIDTLGALTASSGGTNIKGTAKIQIVASTAEDYKALGWGVDGAADSSLSNLVRLVELFVGAGGSEVSLINNLIVNTDNGERIEQTYPAQGIIPVEMNIPAGSRLSANTDSTDNGGLGLVLYGFR